MTTTHNAIFALNSEEMMHLAANLDSQAGVLPPLLPTLPAGPLSEFCQALALAHDNISARDRQLRQDFSQLADLAVTTLHAAQGTDENSAAAFAQQLAGVR